MKIKCAIKTCSAETKKDNSKVKKSGFFYFPNSKNKKDLRKKWIKAVGGIKNLNFSDITSKHLFLCTNHFGESDFLLEDRLSNLPAIERRLQPNAVPSLNVAVLNESKRGKKYNIRERKKIINEILLNSTVISCRGDNELNNDDHIENVLQAPNIENELQLPNINLCKATQTKPSGTNNEDLLNYELDRENKQLKKEISDLKMKLENKRKAEKSIGKLFSKTQLKRLQNSKVKTKWSCEDIGKAISLHAAGPRSYRYLLNAGFPYPAISTLRQYKSKININPGIQKSKKDD